LLLWLQRKLESAVSDVQRHNDKLKEKVAQLSNKVRLQQQSALLQQNMLDRTGCGVGAAGHRLSGKGTLLLVLCILLWLLPASMCKYALAHQPT
jgi:ABC-type polysaccharide/polyol phosphate transport system ATPase subunit